MSSPQSTEEHMSRRSLARAGFWAMVHVFFFSLSHPALVWLLARWLDPVELASFAVAWSMLVLFVILQSGLTLPLPPWRNNVPPILDQAMVHLHLRHHVTVAAILTLLMTALILALFFMSADQSALHGSAFSMLGFALFWPTISLIILPRRIALYLDRVDLSARLSFSYFAGSVALTGLLQALNLLTAISAFLALATAAFLSAWPAIRADRLQPDTGYVPTGWQDVTNLLPQIDKTAIKALFPALTGWAITYLPLPILAMTHAPQETGLYFILLGLIAPMQAFLRITERLHHRSPGQHPLLDGFRKPVVAGSAITGLGIGLAIGLLLEDINHSIFLGRIEDGLSLFWVAALTAICSTLVALLSRGKRHRDPDHGSTNSVSHAALRVIFIAASISATISLGSIGAVAVMAMWQIWRLLRVTYIDWTFR